MKEKVMCNWFSCVVTRDGYIHYINREERFRLNSKGETADHHSRIICEAGLDEFNVDKIEYNPLTKNLKLDRAHGCKHSYWNQGQWRYCWFSRIEILETLESMNISEMLPKGVKFNKKLYDTLFKIQDKSTICFHYRYRYCDSVKLWRGLQGFRKALLSSDVHIFLSIAMALSCTWKSESERRKAFKSKILKEFMEEDLQKRKVRKLFRHKNSKIF